MGLIDLILNLAGLLLWLCWHSLRFDPLGKRTPATLLGTLRRAGPQRTQRWHLLAWLAGLLLLRAGVYWQIGSAWHPVWTGTLDFGAIPISFRSDSFSLMVLYSTSSFALTLGVFYLWLLLLSILAGPEPLHRLVRMQLGGIDRWPRWVKFLLPLVVMGIFWWLATWPLAWLEVGSYSKTNFIPKPVSEAHRLEQAIVIGLGVYPAWKFVAGALLALHLLNGFIYFGNHPFWNYVNAAAQTLLQPLRAVLFAPWQALSFLLFRGSRRTGHGISSPALKIALALLLDVAGIALVFLLAELAERGLVFIYGHLPV